MNPWGKPQWQQPPAMQPGYWQQPAPAPVTPPMWQEQKPDSFFNSAQISHPFSTKLINLLLPPDRLKTRKITNLNPVLAADSSTPIRIDVRKAPASEGVPPEIYYAYRHAYATADYATHIRLISKDFPWSVDIKTQYGTPITCEDIWDAVFTSLNQSLADSEWGLIVGDKERARKIEKCGKKRQEAEKDAKGKKLKRIDWLGDMCIFRGLEKDDEFAKRRTAYADETCSETLVVKMTS